MILPPSSFAGRHRNFELEIETKENTPCNELGIWLFGHLGMMAAS